MLKKIRKYLKANLDMVTLLPQILNLIERQTYNDLKSPKLNLGKIQSYFNLQKQSINDLSEVEFQIFSQWGDDGIIQYLINKVEISNKTFIEFGVENYIESNTRFLLLNDNWTGYVLDGSDINIEYIKRDIISWSNELYSESAFITAGNINELILKKNFDKEVGLLSIDIDGNDYWVWKAINCINPIIVIVEYNSLFGKNTSWTIPYDPEFVRSEKHSSMLYYGASLGALVSLGKSKGYYFIGCNSKGNNAYFLRKDKVGSFKIKTTEEGYVLSKFREHMVGIERVSGIDRLALIEGLDVYDVNSETKVKIEQSLVKY